MNALDWINSTGGLLSGLGTLLLGITALWRHLSWLLKRISRNKKEKEPMKKARQLHYLTLFLGTCLIVVSVGIFTTRIITGQDQPLNVQLTTQAWDAFNRGDYERAIGYADQCINEFRGAADREQEQLEKKQTPKPPNGKVSDKEKQIIWGRGLLNDVGTCFYIKGRSLENLGRKNDARNAYQSAAKYTYARCWDPNGWFWDPSEAASDRLRYL